MKLKSLVFLLPLLVFNCAKERTAKKTLADYIPTNSIAVLKINHLSSLMDSLPSNEFVGRLTETDPYHRMVESLAFLKQMGPESQGILIFSKRDTLPMDFLFITENLENIFGTDSLRIKYEQGSGSENGFSKFMIEDREVYSAIDKELVFIGSSENAIRNALDTQSQNRTDTIFRKLFNVSDSNQPGTLFVRLNKSDSFLSQIVAHDSRFKPSSFSDWMSLDIHSEPNQLLLGGLTTVNDSSSNFLNLFRNTKPLPNTTPSFAPIQASGMLSYSFNDYRVFANNQEHYLQHSPVTDSLFSAVEEIGFIYTGSDRAILLNTYGSEDITNFLAELRQGALEHQGTTILELSKTDFLTNGFKPLIDGFEARYSVILENAFLFSENPEVLREIISNYKNGTTFNQGSLYKTAQNNLSAASTILYIGSPKHMENLIKKELKPEFYRQIKTPKLSGYVFSTQVVADGGFFHTNLSIQKSSSMRRSLGVQPLFRVQLEAEIANRPQFVINHLTNQKEVVVQDQENRLYLISKDGKILWKKALNARIRGKIHQVDLFKNGRLQLAFTTNDHLWVLDRNGKEVKMLCKRFPGGNLNPLAVFDYDQKREYRLVVTQGNRISMYDRKGKIVKGFTYTRSEAPVLNAPKHLVIGNKDHLVFQLENGLLKILNRKGAVRVEVAEPIDFSTNEILLYQSQFAITDTKGVLHQIDQNGKVTRTPLYLNPEHGLDATSKTLVYINDNVLSIRGKKVTLDLGVYSPPIIFVVNDKIYISVTDLQSEKIYLFDSQAETIPGFPIYGNSMIDLADMDGDKNPDLVTKEKDSSLTVYRIYRDF
ncbi:ribonuclease HII [Flavobacteriaceae bacterium TP-CH-4]|uniref:Ribonuclease HII n=1 Tax=Pelagihabitans pacificus TaxID=2696054 RepID=A0A967E7C7_9FLAO|nr:ribonuclease HII [Pelagihabitans pacificus]NHF61457.1 ribonuclease HII [Pelagihabitans pacificus]